MNPQILKDLKQGKPARYLAKHASYQNDPLFPYYEYLYLRSAAPSEKVLLNYLNTYPNLPYSKSLRREMLTRFAKHHQWGEYFKFYQTALGPEFDCHAMTAKQQSTSLSPESIHSLWMTSNPLPASCLGLLTQWRKTGELKSAWIWERFSRVIENDKLSLATQIMSWLPAQEQQEAKIWLALKKNPDTLVENLPKLRTHRQEIVEETLTRLAYRHPTLCMHDLENPSIQKALSPTKQHELTRLIALSLATEGHPKAFQWLNTIPYDSHDTVINSWRVRFALRQGNWESVKQAIELLSPEDQQKPGWRYWYARSLIALGSHSAGKAILTELAPARDYYGFLASRDLQKPVTVFHRSLPIDTGDLTTLANNPYFKQSHYFYEHKELTAARLAWQNGIHPLNDYEKYVASKLATDWGWYDQAIQTQQKLLFQNDMELRFPLAYHTIIEANAKNSGLESSFLYALIRQESGFMADAGSPKGAVGLMQLLPSTATNYLSPPIPTNIDKKLISADTNIELGCKHLKHMLNSVDYHYLLLAAAYNAGGTALHRWLPKQPMAADIWVETIPWHETRHYVKNIVTYYVIYQTRSGKSPDWDVIMRDISI